MKHEGEACAYQGADLLNYSEGVQFYGNHHHGNINLVQSYLKEHMTGQENELLKAHPEYFGYTRVGKR